MKIALLFLKLLLNGGLLCIAAIKPLKHLEIESTKYELPKHVVPLHYDIKLLLYDSNDFATMHGESNVTIEVRHETSIISLHTLYISIQEIMLRNTAIGINQELLMYTYSTNANIVEFDFGSVIPRGTYTLYIKYISYLVDNTKNNNFRTYIHEHTPYMNEDGIKVLQIATLSQPCSVRRLFPCWDEPFFEATFNVSISHRNSYTAVFNSPELKSRIKENEMVRSYFHKTVPTPTYRLSLFIVLSNIIAISNTNETVSIWCDSNGIKEVMFAFKVAQMVKHKLNWYKRSSYEMRKMDLVLIKDFNEKYIGNWGNNIYRESHVLYDEKYDGFMKKIEVARLVARATAYQWLDNALTFDWWTDIWLNEGFAILFQVDVLNQVFPEWRIPDLYVVQMQHESLHLDAEYNMMPLIHDVRFSPKTCNSLLSLPFYVKAPAIVRMLQHIVSNLTINPEALYIYFDTNQFKGVNSDEFWDIMQNRLQPTKSDQKNNYNLSEVMSTWSMQQMYPILTVKRNYTSGEVSVSQENSNKIDKNKWWVPVTYTTQKRLDFSKISPPTAWLEPHSDTLTLDELCQENEWIIFNLQQTGYYRVSYDNTNWRLIAEYLNSKDYKKIHVINRAQIINDVYHFTAKKQLPIDIFLDVTSYLSNETDYIAWYPMFKVLENLSIYFPYKKFECLKGHMRDILSKLLLKIGYKEVPKEDEFIKCLRQEAAKWACVLNDTKCKSEAYKMLQMHLEDNNSIKLGWKPWAYHFGFEAIQDYQSSKMGNLDKLLFYANDYVVKRYMYKMNKNGSPKSTETTTINTSAYSIILTAKTDLKSALNLLQYYNTHFITKVLALVIDGIYSWAKLDQVSKFVQSNLETNLMEETITLIRNKIQTRIRHMQRQLKRMKMWDVMWNISKQYKAYWD